MSVLRRALAIRPRDWRDIARAYFYLTVAGWRLFVRRQRIDRWLDASNPANPDTPLTPEESDAVARAARWTNAAARHPFVWARCLQRSLALCLWLDRENRPARIRLGVRRNEEGLTAHAWVAYRGQIINDAEDVEADFARLRGLRS